MGAIVVSLEYAHDQNEKTRKYSKFFNQSKRSIIFNYRLVPNYLKQII